MEVAVLPEKKDCCRGWRNQKYPQWRCACGLICLILSLLILLLCAPDWMVAMLVAALMAILGVWLLWGCRRF